MYTNLSFVEQISEGAKLPVDICKTKRSARAVLGQGERVGSIGACSPSEQQHYINNKYIMR